MNSDERAGRYLLSLRQALAGKQVDLPDHFRALVRQYQEPSRHYHTQRHIVEGWDLLDEIIGVSASVALYFAWAFHDAACNPHHNDNEEKSSRFAALVNNAMGMIFGGGIDGMISSTKYHKARCLDQALIIDADLSIFGTAEERFQEYETQIRKEYDWVDEETFRTKRVELLEGFLNRSRIFHTNYFHDRFEACARQNLARSIRTLRGK